MKKIPNNASYIYQIRSSFTGYLYYWNKNKIPFQISGLFIPHPLPSDHHHGVSLHCGLCWSYLLFDYVCIVHLYRNKVCQGNHGAKHPPWCLLAFQYCRLLITAGTRKTGRSQGISCSVSPDLGSVGRWRRSSPTCRRRNHKLRQNPSRFCRHQRSMANLQWSCIWRSCKGRKWGGRQTSYPRSQTSIKESAESRCQ